VSNLTVHESASGALPPTIARPNWLTWALVSSGWLVIAALLFWNLGVYALWDDEANTALFASNVWKTGDTTAWDGTNIIAFRGGLELTGIKNRAYPPLQYFYAAPFVGLFGHNAWAARLPFALAALAGFTLWGYWLYQARASRLTIALTGFFVLGNVSLFLYSRQSRYYPLAWGLGVALAYLYLRRHQSARNRWLFCLGSVALLSCHYLAYGAAMVCLLVDYLAFEIWRKNDTWKQRAIFCGSQLLGLLVIVGIFYPFGRKVTEYVPVSWWADKLRLFVWNLRDLDSCEYLWLPIVGLGLVVGVVRRDQWLVRAVLALIVYAFMASVLSPQPVGWDTVADIRYMSTTIPLGIFISARAVMLGFRLDRPRVAAAVPAFALAALLSFSTLAHSFWQNLIHAPTPIERRSTFWVWLQELVSPQRSAFADASAWLNANLSPGAMAFVLPDFALYPLMFHAPGLKYMWQFGEDQRAAYPMLPPHHFRFLGVPEAIVAFGAARQARGLANQLGRRHGVAYVETRLAVFGPDRTRPELFWRTFITVPPDDSLGEGTFIFRRVAP
jgi:4-amino-4-deoxy-L-arabinose transferase-like glycosyltransferase